MLGCGKPSGRPLADGREACKRTRASGHAAHAKSSGTADGCCRQTYSGMLDRCSAQGRALPVQQSVSVDGRQLLNALDGFLQGRDEVDLDRVPLAQPALEGELANRIDVVGLDRDKYLVVRHRHVSGIELDS